ncbi:MAG: acyl carrier protein [Candidatus Scalindua sp.]|jgi:acyl carrier protein|nr:acyl carrier protein [Candidatus Scalindua sp.]MBT6051624.1 acyl carrier protein [Candidatus Scalindua sp.]
MEKKSVKEITEILVRDADIILSDQTEKISSEATLADLGFDSMSFIELLVSIEKKFDVKLIEIGMQPADIKSLEALAHYIYQLT